MSHLSLETIARIVDEGASAEEKAHLDACRICTAELDGMREDVQSLHMMNSRALQDKLSSKEGRVKQLAESKATAAEIVTELYLQSLSRLPNAEELEKATAVFSAGKATRQTATEDVLWALLNSPEFVFNH